MPPHTKRTKRTPLQLPKAIWGLIFEFLRFKPHIFRIQLVSKALNAACKEPLRCDKFEVTLSEWRAGLQKLGAFRNLLRIIRNVRSLSLPAVPSKALCAELSLLPHLHFLEL